MQGSTNITLQFDLSRDIDAAAQDVQTMIARAARQLPPQMPSPPSYMKVNPGDYPVMLLVMRSPTLPLSTVNEYADSNVSQRISMVNGVAQVNVFGPQKYAVRIDVDPRKLSAHGIGIDEVVTAIQASNVNLPTGTMSGRERIFTVLADGQLLECRGVRADGGRVPKRQSRAARRRRARVRRRRAGQDRELVSGDAQHHA